MEPLVHMLLTALGVFLGITVARWIVDAGERRAERKRREAWERDAPARAERTMKSLEPYMQMLELDLELARRIHPGTVTPNVPPNPERAP